MARNLYVLATIFFTLYLNICKSMSVELINEFYNVKAISVVYVFYCLNKGEKTFLKELSRTSIRFSFYNIRNRNVPFEQFYIEDYNSVGIVLDTECLNSQKVLLSASEQQLYSYGQHWLLFGNAFLNETLEILQNLYLNINSDVKFAIRMDEMYEIYDVYNPASYKGGRIVVNYFGNFIENNFNVLKQSQSFYWSRKNMSKATFRVMTVLPRPFEGKLEDYLLNDEHHEINTFNRYNTLLLFNCRDMFNFSLTMSNGTSWGYLIKDNIFDGMVGALQNRTIDFGGSPIFCKKDRIQCLDYGTKTWTFKSAFLFRNPKREASFSVFLRPLSESVWIATMIALIIMFVLLELSLRAEKCFNNNEIENNCSYLILVIVSSLCQQGSEHNPRLHSGRVITFTLFTFTVLIYQFYSASIVSSLLMKPPSLINTLEDLLRSSLKAGCEDIIYNRDYFNASNDPVIRELFKRKIVFGVNQSSYMTPEKGLELVAKSNYAFQVEIAIAFPIIETMFTNNQICDLAEVQMIPTQGLFMVFQKNCPFRDMINFCMRLMEERGVYRRLIIHWQARKPNCLQNAVTQTDSVSLKEFYPAFVALCMGILSSLLLLPIEIYIKKRSQRRLYPYVN